MRISRAYEAGSEFKARQGAFGFAEVAFAVVEIVQAGKREMAAWLKAKRKAWFMPVIQVQRKFQQLVLELDGIAKMPLFGRG